MTGEVHVAHDGRRILVSNLLQREGGIAWYKVGRATRSDYTPDTLIEDARDYEWSPEGCTNCSYAAACSHNTNLLQQIPLLSKECRQIKDTPPREPLETTREKLHDVLQQCMESHENKIFVIKCDTGVGKTEELLNQELDGVCVAFDTHRLKQEAYDRLLEKGQTAYLWPDPPRLPAELKKQLERYYALGVGGTKAILEKALACVEVSNNSEWTAMIQEHLQALSDIHTVRSILTTHEKAFQLGNNSLIHTFVFDEDFIKTLIRIEEVRPQDVKAFKKKALDSHDENSAELVMHLKTVINAPAETNHSNTLQKYPSALVREILLQMPKSFESPIEALFCCAAFRKDHPGQDAKEIIYCINCKPLLEDRKYVILSATADEEIYRRLFGDRLEFIDISGTMLRGALICHTASSFSKSRISEDQAAFVKKVKGDMESLGFDGVITHKMCAEVRTDGLYLSGSDGTVPVLGTFGALQGLDVHGGRNIAVYGTPYPSEHVVRLWALLLGLAVDEDATDYVHRTVEWGEYELSVYTCFDTPDVQHLYLWLAQTEIVQAVGRARLVDNDCTVHVFAKLPVSGCALVE
jgi:hypothetical protein